MRWRNGRSGSEPEPAAGNATCTPAASGSATAGDGAPAADTIPRPEPPPRPINDPAPRAGRARDSGERSLAVGVSGRMPDHVLAEAERDVRELEQHVADQHTRASDL